VVECAGFENRSARKGSGSSNLPLSAVRDREPFNQPVEGFSCSAQPQMAFCAMQLARNPGAHPNPRLSPGVFFACTAARSPNPASRPSSRFYFAASEVRKSRALLPARQVPGFCRRSGANRCSRPRLKDLHHFRWTRRKARPCQLNRARPLIFESRAMFASGSPGDHNSRRRRQVVVHPCPPTSMQCAPSDYIGVKPFLP
jgi:hypothetical protein